MNLQLTKKNIMIALVAIAVLGLLVGSYFYFLVPLKKEIEVLKNELATEDKLYETISQQVATTKNDVIENSRIVQKKLPVESFIEQFILDLEKAEVVSNSLIEDITFQEKEITEGDVIIDSEDAEVDGQRQQSVDEQNSDAIADNETQNSEQQPVPGIPAGMKRITLNITVTSENYFDMHRFLETIENLERITKIDSLSFTGGEEVLTVDQEIEELSYTVVLSTFYYPTLTELSEELPTFEVPKPSNKDNPLPTGMYYKEEQTKTTKTSENGESIVNEVAETIIDSKTFKEHQQSVQQQQKPNRDDTKPTEESKKIEKQAVMSGNSMENNKTETKQQTNTLFTTHTVKKGDTLFSISMKYFNANRVDEIKKLNNLYSDAINEGQTIKIAN